MQLKTFILLLSTLTQISYCCVHVELDDGVIKGRIATIPESKKTFYAFQEIPYAAPPIGNLRFKPPQPVSKWEGVLDTTKNTKICYQVTSNSELETEDCLYLNVYTPQLLSKTNGTLLPVMVFIHGGGFIIGDAIHEHYGPEFLITYDVIIVTLNYRLGVFGFLSTQDEVIPGNNGLKDQVLALEWVNKNIHIFGGDCSKITIFGQSAGAASVGYHLISKKSRGLYRAAIMESGSSLNAFGYQRNAKHYAYKIASLINSNVTEDNTSQDVLDILLAASTTEIDNASSIINSQEGYADAQLFQGYYFAPVIELESDDAFLTEKMFEIINRGDANSVPIIIGINSEESVSQTTDLNFMKRLMSAYDNDLKALVPLSMNIDDHTKRTEAGGRIRQMYSRDNLLQNVPAAGIKYMSDSMITRAVIKHALLQSKFSDVYFYQFSYDGMIGNVSIVVEGADLVGHNEEIAYIWRVRNDMFDNYNMSIFPGSDITTHRRLLKLWTNFAKTLNPTPEKVKLFQNITWPTVSSSDNFPYLNINEDLEIKYQPKEDIFSGWNKVYEEFGTEPYDTY